MAMSVDPGNPLEECVESLVTSGRYRSRSEVVHDGVRLVQEREAMLEQSSVRGQDGLDAADRGETHEPHEPHETHEPDTVSDGLPGENPVS